MSYTVSSIGAQINTTLTDIGEQPLPGERRKTSRKFTPDTAVLKFIDGTLVAVTVTGPMNDTGYISGITYYAGIGDRTWPAWVIALAEQVGHEYETVTVARPHEMDTTT